MITFTTVEEYIQSFPDEIQHKLNGFLQAIQETAPAAQETINYGISTFKLGGNLVHFAAYKNHIGFYPAPSAIKQFQEELSSYKTAKGSVQFPLDQPLPFQLIKDIVAFRVREIAEKEGE